MSGGFSPVLGDTGASFSAAIFPKRDLIPVSPGDLILASRLTHLIRL
jgi:hypothetical protein